LVSKINLAYRFLGEGSWVFLVLRAVLLKIQAFPPRVVEQNEK
jgi:hypothetical protein